MKIKSRSIISVILILAMVFTVAAFTSCSGNGEKEVSFTVHVAITGSDGIVQENDLLMTGLPSDLTVLAATKRMCEEVLQIDFVYDETLNAVTQIGPDTLNKEAVAEAVAEDVTTAEGETTAVEATTNDGSYYDWQGYLNGAVASPTDKIKEGDKIEWKWEKFLPETAGK